MRSARAALFVVPLAVALVSAIAGGLARAGIAVANNAWIERATLDHATLMICAFMGSVIAVERAVALKHRAAWLAPGASIAAGLALVSGWQLAGAWLLVAAAIVFVAVNAAIVRRQAAPHTLMLLGSAGAWLAGNLAFATRVGAGAAVPFWFAFLVMTIAAERLEMTRLARRRAGAQPALQAGVTLLLAGAAASAVDAMAGGVLYGSALVALALWLLAFDIARRTVMAQGLTRYMALCLLAGYGWLAVAGIAWIATALGAPARDIALHALGLGFVLSMMMGHAPVILPAVAGVKLRFHRGFYLPFAALHLSLLARLAGGWASFEWRSDGALANALAIVLFAATTLMSAKTRRA